MTNQKVKIIAFTGMAGAGKSSAIDYMTAKGIPKVYVGGLILEGVKAAGMEPTQENERIYREEMRRKHGNDYFIRLAVEQLHRLIDAGQRQIVFDGLYSWTEYKYLKHEFPGQLVNIAIVAPRTLRHRRIENRPVRPLTNKQATERDWSEIENLEKGGPIAIADYFVIKDGNLDDLHAKLEEITQHEHFCKAPEQC